MKFLLYIVLAFGSQVSLGLCVKGRKANLRSGPGVKYPISWTVQKNMPLLEVSRRGSWVEVKDVDGSRHWAYRSILTSQRQCLVVKTNKANLRSGPGKQFPLASPLPRADRYFAFEKVDSDMGYYKVKVDGVGPAWIHESLVWRALTVQKIGF